MITQDQLETRIEFGRREESLESLEYKLHQLGIKLLSKTSIGPESPIFLRQIGFVDYNYNIESSEIVTSQFLAGSEYGGWIRGGAESYYRVWKVRLFHKLTNQWGTKYLAEKANIAGFGEGINLGAQQEALRLGLLHQHNRAPKVYAVGSGTIYKDWLLSDEILDDPEAEKNLQRLLTQEGIKAVNSRIGTNAIVHNGKLKFIDLGNGDFAGPN